MHSWERRHGQFWDYWQRQPDLPMVPSTQLGGQCAMKKFGTYSSLRSFKCWRSTDCALTAQGKPNYIIWNRTSPFNQLKLSNTSWLSWKFYDFGSGMYAAQILQWSAFSFRMRSIFFSKRGQGKSLSHVHAYGWSLYMHAEGVSKPLYASSNNVQTPNRNHASKSTQI